MVSDRIRNIYLKFWQGYRVEGITSWAHVMMLSATDPNARLRFRCSGRILRIYWVGTNSV